MADFRKWILALTVLALFAGLASAQSNLITCSPGTTGIPQLRGEGLTEEVGDIIIQCAGGTFLPAGSVIPTANFVVYLNGTVTSRLLGSSNSLPQASEAVLMIDEPQTPASGCLHQFFRGRRNQRLHGIREHHQLRAGNRRQRGWRHSRR